MTRIAKIANAFRTLERDFQVFCVLATLALGGGLTFNAFRDKPLPMVYQSKAERIQAQVEKLKTDMPSRSEPAALPSEMTLEEFQKFVESGTGWVLDARPEIFHRFGHVPGALSLAREDFEASYERLRTQLETDKAKPLAIYCSGSACEDSELVQQALLRLGYTRVAIFRGGWNAWTQAGLKEEK